jgi:hypothetical protein
MGATGQYLHLRLFLEGVEVPVISAQIQSQKNSPAAASIQIVANDYALDLRPRTLVHLFAFDIYNGVPPEDTVQIGAPGTRVSSRDDGVDPELAGLFPPERFASTVEQDRTDLVNENYKLIFGGELIGFSFQKSPTSRSIVLQCLDWSSYWDIGYQYQVAGFSLGGGGTRAAFTGASTTVFNDFLEGSGDIVARIIQRPPRSYPSLAGTLLGGITHIIEAVGGVYFGQRAVRGTNDFFSLAEIRLHITQMVGANPYSNRDENRLLAANGFGSLFRRSLAGLGRLVSIRAILLALQRYIFHEIIPITSPRYIPPIYDPNLPRYEEVGLDADPQTRRLAQAAQRIKNQAQELLDRQNRIVDSVSAADPSAFGAGFINTTAALNNRVQESDARGGLYRELDGLIRVCRAAARQARLLSIELGESSGSLPDQPLNINGCSRLFSVSGSWFSEIIAVLENRTTGEPRADVSSPEEVAARVSAPRRRSIYFRTATSRAGQIVLQRLQLIIDNMQSIMDLRYRRRIQRTTQQPDPPPRLLTQIYRPDVWMTSPPRCNVVFPELYSQFAFARNYQQETTRLLLRTHSAFYGSDILFDGFYMAPANILGVRRGRPVTRGRPASIENVEFPLHIRRDLLDHELYTGIIPAFERMSDLNLHALRNGYFEVNNTRIGYAQLACNHIFFQKRYQSRQLQMSGRFNPYVVLGFPMLIIDRYLPVDELREGSYNATFAARLRSILAEGDGIQTNPTTDEQRATVEANYARINEIVADVLTARPNTHYLGTPEMISHSLDASSGGTTQIQMSYARTTNERTEYLGDNVGTTGRRTRSQRLVTIVAAWEEPVVGTVGFRGGRIAEVRDVTDEFTRRAPRRRSAASSGSGAPATAVAQDTSGNYLDARGNVIAPPPRVRRTTRTTTGATRYSSTRTAPLYVANAPFTFYSRRGTRVVVGVEQPAQSYGPEVVALVGSGGSFDSSTVSRARWSGINRTGSAGSGDSTLTEILVTFRAYRIVETVGVYSRTDVTLPAEFMVYPPWYGNHWRPNQIGGLYAYFFGTGAITDPLVVRSGSADSSRANPRAPIPDSDPDTANRAARTLSVEFTRRIGDPDAAVTPGAPASESRPEPGATDTAGTSDGEVIGPAGEDNTPEEEFVDSIIGQIPVRSPIGLAAEEVVRIYSQVKLNRYDVHSFIRAYSWRPIASMIDLFGTANLEINDQGEVTRGVEGFHSRAFGDFDDLRQIIGPGDGSRPRTILGLAVDNPDETSDDARAAAAAPIAARMDTRKEKRTAVLRYLLYLMSSCGVLG